MFSTKLKLCYFFTKFVRAFLVTLRGVAGPHPFWKKFKLGIFSKLFKHRVANGLKKYNFCSVMPCLVTLRGSGSVVPIF